MKLSPRRRRKKILAVWVLGPFSIALKAVEDIFHVDLGSMSQLLRLPCVPSVGGLRVGGLRVGELVLQSLSWDLARDLRVWRG